MYIISFNRFWLDLEIGVMLILRPLTLIKLGLSYTLHYLLIHSVASFISYSELWIRFLCSRDSSGLIEPNSLNLLLSRAPHSKIHVQHKFYIHVLPRGVQSCADVLKEPWPVRCQRTSWVTLSFVLIAESVSSFLTTRHHCFVMLAPLYPSPLGSAVPGCFLP